MEEILQRLKRLTVTEGMKERENKGHRAPQTGIKGPLSHTPTFILTLLYVRPLLYNEDLKHHCKTTCDLNMKILSSFTPFTLQMCMTFILLPITNKDILKNAGKQAIGFHCIFFP